MNERVLSRGFDNSSKVFHYDGGRPLSQRALQSSLAESGFAIIRGVPVDEYTSDNARIGATIHFLHGLTFLGPALKQNSEGDLGWLVRNEGTKVESKPGKGQRIDSGKGSKSNSDLGMHNDAAAQWHGYTIDRVALLVFAQAPKGGDTTLVDAREAFELLSEENPKAAETLTNTTFYFDRSSGHDVGQRPYAEGPVISLRDGFRVRHTPRIHQGFEVAGKEPSPEQLLALVAWNEILNRPELHIQFKLQPGDLLLLNENIMLHGRTSFTDDPENPRTLVRSWLSWFGSST